jgi:hypothetical protein
MGNPRARSKNSPAPGGTKKTASRHAIYRLAARAHGDGDVSQCAMSDFFFKKSPTAKARR